MTFERRAFEETKHQLLAVEGHAALLSDPTAGLLQAKLALRTPYITPLNILQVGTPCIVPGPSCCSSLLADTSGVLCPAAHIWVRCIFVVGLRTLLK